MSGGTTYYNDNDPYAAAWLRELIKDGHLPQGFVDERSVEEVKPSDLSKYTHCHFFAGIGGWPLAIGLAGWPPSRPVWTGSCPCQPFSTAGKQKAQADKRHVWPQWFKLLRECKPECIFGEQVEGAIRLGWLDGICADLEGEGYAVGSVVLGAHSVGAPHMRQRLYWVADRMVNTASGQQSRAAKPKTEGQSKLAGRPGDAGDRVATTIPNHWSKFDLVRCKDGRSRRIEPRSFPLAYGVPGRVGLLRGYGNAIVPQVAAEFVAAYLDVRQQTA